MQLQEMNLWQVMIFRLYILYNKHKMIKIGTQNREISQVLSQVLEYFFGGVYVKFIKNGIAAVLFGGEGEIALCCDWIISKLNA